eukprot:Gregarina_sp_Poly_1__9423@NODE_58_length_17191_cov_34_446508_g49_i0_p6_GENE_NODE_58_length_17191_cov_34_446508_g49_i0NODE_58_length_17191_cov_34_446508_g49_i0_p6_ORF_typecomplete_len408_score54_74_NODE_58_length_17191_cov_34_446508_g49_i058517074
MDSWLQELQSRFVDIGESSSLTHPAPPRLADSVSFWSPALLPESRSRSLKKRSAIRGSSASQREENEPPPSIRIRNHFQSGHNSMSLGESTLQHLQRQAEYEDVGAQRETQLYADNNPITSGGDQLFSAYPYGTRPSANFGTSMGANRPNDRPNLMDSITGVDSHWSLEPKQSGAKDIMDEYEKELEEFSVKANSGSDNRVAAQAANHRQIQRAVTQPSSSEKLSDQQATERLRLARHVIPQAPPNQPRLTRGINGAPNAGGLTGFFPPQAPVFTPVEMAKFVSAGNDQSGQRSEAFRSKILADYERPSIPFLAPSNWPNTSQISRAFASPYRTAVQQPPPAPPPPSAVDSGFKGSSLRVLPKSLRTSGLTDVECLSILSSLAEMPSHELATLIAIELRNLQGAKTS